MNTPTKFCSDWLYDFREEQKIFLENRPMNIPINLGSNYHIDLKY